MKYSWKKYFETLRLLKLFIKSFVALFVDIALTLSNSSFDLFLFEVTFLFKCVSLSPKSVFFTKTAIPVLLAKFACANLAAKFYDVKLLNSCVAIYLLLWLWLTVISFPVTLIFVF